MEKLLPANEKFSKCVANIKSTLIIRPNHKFLHEVKSVEKFIFFPKISPKNNQKIGGLYVKLSQKIFKISSKNLGGGMLKFVKILLLFIYV